jgi:hypothetical protein
VLRPASPSQLLNQFEELGTQALKFFAVHCRQLIQHLRASLCQPHVHPPPVVLACLALDESGSDQPIDKPHGAMVADL